MSGGHSIFHQTLLAGCASPRLEGIVTSLRDSAELYRRWYWALTSDHARDMAGELRQLRDFAVARNAKPAVAALTEHIERAPRELIAYAQQHSLDAAPPSATAKTRPLPTAPPAAPAQALQARYEPHVAARAEAWLGEGCVRRRAPRRSAASFKISEEVQ